MDSLLSVWGSFSAVRGCFAVFQNALARLFSAQVAASVPGLQLTVQDLARKRKVEVLAQAAVC